MNMTARLMSVREVAKVLHVSRASAYKLLDNNTLPMVAVGGRKMVPVAAVDKLVAGQQTNGTSQPQQHHLPDDDISSPDLASLHENVIKLNRAITEMSDAVSKMIIAQMGRGRGSA
jgi:excisionase family DNA binding protein